MKVEAVAEHGKHVAEQKSHGSSSSLSSFIDSSSSNGFSEDEKASQASNGSGSLESLKEYYPDDTTKVLDMPPMTRKINSLSYKGKNAYVV